MRLMKSFAANAGQIAKKNTTTAVVRSSDRDYLRVVPAGSVRAIRARLIGDPESVAVGDTVVIMLSGSEVLAMTGGSTDAVSSTGVLATINSPASSIDYSKIVVVAPDGSSVQYDGTVAGLEAAIAAAVDWSTIYLPEREFDISTATSGKLTITNKILSFVGQMRPLDSDPQNSGTRFVNRTGGILFDLVYTEGNLVLQFIDCYFFSETATGNSSILYSATGGFIAYFLRCYMTSSSTDASGGAWILLADYTLSADLSFDHCTVQSYHMYYQPGILSTGDLQTIEAENTIFFANLSVTSIGEDAPITIHNCIASAGNILPGSTANVVYGVSDRAGWLTDGFHSSDIYDEAFTNHVPAPTAAGKTIVSAGTDPFYWTEAAAGGGSGSGSFWSAMVPPATPNALDDEFSDNSIDAKWTTFNLDSTLVVSEQANGLSMHNTGANVAGIFQAVPASNEFTVWTRISPLGVRERGYGLFLAEDLVDNPTTSRILTINYGQDSYKAMGATINLYSEYDDNAPQDLYNGFEDYTRPGMFLRARYNDDSLVHIDMSYDGISWTNRVSDIGFTPKQIGLFSADATNGNAIFSFFRVTDLIDDFQIMYGGLAGGGSAASGVDYSKIVLIYPDNSSKTFAATVDGIQQAIDEAQEDSTIIIPAGTYYTDELAAGHLVIGGKSGLTLIGSQHSDTNIEYNGVLLQSNTEKVLDVSGDSYIKLILNNLAIYTDSGAFAPSLVTIGSNAYLDLYITACDIHVNGSQGYHGKLVSTGVTENDYVDITIRDSNISVYDDYTGIPDYLINDTDPSGIQNVICYDTQIFARWVVGSTSFQNVYTSTGNDNTPVVMPTNIRYGLSDRASWITDAFHSQDIYAEELTHHVPVPIEDGHTLISVGNDPYYWDQVQTGGDVALGDIATEAILGLGGGGQEIFLDTQAATYALMGPVSGVDAQPAFRAIVASDLPSPTRITGLSVYANNAAALADGKTAGDLYRDNSDPSRVCVAY